MINLFYFNGKFSNSSAPKTKEKADYAECTSMAFNNFNFEFLLVIQDDVVAKENALKNIIKVKNDEITNFNLISVKVNWFYKTILHNSNVLIPFSKINFNMSDYGLSSWRQRSHWQLDSGQVFLPSGLFGFRNKPGINPGDNIVLYSSGLTFVTDLQLDLPSNFHQSKTRKTSLHRK